MLSLFANPFAMLAGVLLISSPIIIHLINRMRFKRVRWAAMEFLLASQKKNRTYVMLKQLLLLAMRMAAILAIIFIIARPLFKDPRWAHLLGGPLDASSFAAAGDDEAIVPVSELAALKSRVSVVEGELERLRGLVDRLYGELDIPR